MDLFLFATGLVIIPVALIYLIVTLIKKNFSKKIFVFLLAGGFTLCFIGLFMPNGEREKVPEQVSEYERRAEEILAQSDNEPDNEKNQSESKVSTPVQTSQTSAVDGKQDESVANAELYPAKPGAMLYDKEGSKFKGMKYHFKGKLIKSEKVEGLAGNFEIALLVKNEHGYVMPIFPPYEVSVTAGDEIEVWGLLSGDGYASSDLGVENVVGVAGAINATRIDVNGESK